MARDIDSMAAESKKGDEGGVATVDALVALSAEEPHRTLTQAGERTSPRAPGNLHAGPYACDPGTF